MDRNNYYDETKWCETCQNYVRYLMSMDSSYCASCGRKVRLFSKKDAKDFSSTLEKKKWKAS